MNDLTTELDLVFATKFRTGLESSVETHLESITDEGQIGGLTKLVLEDAVKRAQISKPIAAMASMAGTGAIAKATTAVMATTIAKKVAAKAAAKSVGKGVTSMIGFGTGAALCAWTGPGAAACGIIGGVAA
ncbi:MAG: hypothetical protein P8M25_18320, partial [Paracoccaceae bacterium]|nr:hypothetical protein [Paracoccaceae bacterium]